MKKLLVITAGICSAIAAHAATVSWNSGTFYTAANADGGFSTTKIGNKASAYFFVLTEAEYTTFKNAYTANGNMKAVWDTYSSKLSSTSPAATTGSRSNAATISTTASVNETVYGALIYTYKDATLDKDFYIANIATGTVGSDAGLPIQNLASIYLGGASGTSTGGWQSVPEPTSGLLLLLGLAGLALKRKNA